MVASLVGEPPIAPDSEPPAVADCAQLAASFEIAAEIARVQLAQTDQPTNLVAPEIVGTLIARCAELPEAWSAEVREPLQHVLDHAGSEADDALLTDARGVAAANAYSVGEDRYPDYWETHMRPLAQQLRAGGGVADPALVADLLQKAATAVDQLRNSAVQEVRPPMVQPGTSVEGAQPSEDAEAWAPDVTIPDAAQAVAPARPTAEQILHAARSQIGDRYRELPTYRPGSYIDCSGLVQYSLAQAGVHVPRTSQQQWSSSVGRRIPVADMRAGDVVSLNNGTGRQPGHTAIYAGGGQLIVASSGAGRVIRQPLSTWNGKIIGVKRYTA